MGLSVGAVRCHWARGRDRLRVAVRGCEARSPCVPVPQHPPHPAAIPPAWNHRAMVCLGAMGG
jgi:hypothetical protein